MPPMVTVCVALPLPKFLSVAKYRWADSRHLDRVPRGLIAAGVTVARRSEVDDAFLLDRLDSIADDTRLVERFSEIADVVADHAAAGVGERKNAGGEILLADKLR